jgi:hypothetical protein
MKSIPEFSVTLSDELFDQLRSRARRLHVPLKWLVASLVCDTLEPFAEPIPINDPRQPRRSLHVA